MTISQNFVGSMLLLVLLNLIGCSGSETTGYTCGEGTELQGTVCVGTTGEASAEDPTDDGGDDGSSDEGSGDDSDTAVTPASQADLPAGSLTFTHWNVFRFTKFYQSIGWTSAHGEEFLQALNRCDQVEAELASHTSGWSDFCASYNDSTHYVGTGLKWWNGNYAQGSRTEASKWGAGSNPGTTVYQEHNSNRTQFYEPFVELDSDVFNVVELGLDHDVPALFTDMGYHVMVHAGAHAGQWGNTQGRYPTGTMVKNTGEAVGAQKRLGVKYSVNLMGLDVSDGGYGRYDDEDPGQPFFYPQGYTVVEHKGVPILFFVVHFKDGTTPEYRAARHLEVDRLAEHITELSATFRHIVVSGDFNDTDSSISGNDISGYLHTSMSEVGLYNARTKDGTHLDATYEYGSHQGVTGNSIDHVFVTADLYESITKTEVISGAGFGKNSAARSDARGDFRWSDHLPVRVEFTFE